MKLYSKPGACSMVPHTALEWSKEKYDLELVDNAKIKSPEYLKINPQGAVPLITDGDFVLSQNVAVLDYIHSVYPQAKLFGTGDAKKQAKVKHFLAYFNADVHKTFGPIFHADGYLSKGECKADLIETAKQKIIEQMQYPNDTLEGQEYLTGELTIADVYLYVLLRWAKQVKIDLSQYANLTALMKRVEENDGVKAVIQQEKLQPLA